MRTFISALMMTGFRSSAALADAPPGIDPDAYSGPAWSPYLVGALIGVLVMVTLYVSNKPLGASSAYARVAGLVGRLFSRSHTESLSFYQKKRPRLDWGTLLVFGVIGGAFVAAWSGGELTGRWLPPLWEARFGEGTVGMRLLFAFVGGAIMAFGARLAGGCTSGHGISGTLQLSVGSWIALFCFFISGVVMAMIMYRT